jgi:hypothetical protein
MGLGTAWAALKGLSWFSKGAGLVSWIPVVGGPLGAFLGFLGALIQFLCIFATKVLKGLLSIFKTPVEILALVVVAMLCLAMGLHWGVRYSGHLVKEARLEVKEAKAETLGLIEGLESADAEDQALAEAADTAAKAAEQLERERIAHEAEAQAGVAPGTKLDPPPSAVYVDRHPPLGLLNLPAAGKDKVRRKKPEPGVLETVVQPFVNAFDASKW